MSTKTKIILGIVSALALGLVIFAPQASRALGATTFNSQQLAGSASNGYILSTDGTNNSWIPNTGGTFAWTPQSWGNSTSTTIGFLSGLLSNGSTTVTGTLHTDSQIITTGSTLQFSGYSALPQIYAGDSTTGLHFDGPGIFSIHNGGNQTILFSSTNRVGIASSSPTALLSLHGSSINSFQNLFQIGSSTASATTTLFNINNKGDVLITGSTTVGSIFQGGGLTTCTGTSALTYSGTAFTCTAQPQGTVTSVTGTWPIISSGGATPNLTFGWATTSQPSSSNLFVSNGTNGFYGVATTSATINNGLTGTLTTLGSGQTIGLATINAGVLGAVVNGSVPTSQATSTLYGTGIGGQVLTWNNGVPQWIATTTFTGGTGISTSFSNGQVTITNTGLATFPWTPATNFGVNFNSTTTPIWLKTPVSGTVSLAASSSAWFDQINVGSTSNSTMATSTFFAPIRVKGLTQFSDQEVTKLTTATRVQFEDIDGNNSDWSFRVASGGWGTINFGASQGTLSVPTATVVGNTLGSLNAYGYTGTAYKKAANISFFNDATSSLLSMQGGISFSTARPNNIASVFEAMRIDGSQRIGIGTTTPHFLLQLASSTAPQLALSDGSLTSNHWTFRNINGNFYLATASPATYATSSEAVVGITTFWQFASWLKVWAYDVVNGWTGIISPTRTVALSTATTTTWTATSSGAYIPYVVAPFAGTIKQARCYLDGSFLGVEVDINGSAVTPKYFVASSTVGKVGITSGNTFNAGDRISTQFGTTTSASTLSANCSLDVIQTQ